MTTDTAADADTSPGRALRRGTAVRSLAVAVVALALVACLVPGYRWWSQPDLFQDHGDAMGMDPAPVTHAARAAAVTFPDADTRESAAGTHLFRRGTDRVRVDMTIRAS